jgi:hypothetical protein
MRALRTRILPRPAIALTAMITVFAIGAPAPAGAGDAASKPRVEQTFQGLVQLVPPSGLGFWRIGSRVLEVDPFTEVLLSRTATGPAVGDCALVRTRGTRVVRMMLRPASAC